MSNVPVPIIKIREVNIRCHAHATESLEKVKSALKFLIHIPVDDEKDFQIENMTGSNGNPIRAVIMSFKTQKKIKDFMENLGSSLPLRTKGILISEFENRLDEKYRFYFRLQKQALVLHEYKLANSGDIVKVTLFFHNKNPRAQVSSEDFKDYLKTYNF